MSEHIKITITTGTWADVVRKLLPTLELGAGKELGLPKSSVEAILKVSLPLLGTILTELVASDEIPQEIYEDPDNALPWQFMLVLALPEALGHYGLGKPLSVSYTDDQLELVYAKPTADKAAENMTATFIA